MPEGYIEKLFGVKLGGRRDGVNLKGKEDKGKMNHHPSNCFANKEEKNDNYLQSF